MKRVFAIKTYSKALLLSMLAMLLATPGVSFADYLEVSRNATLKAAPDRDAIIVLRLEPGEELLLLEGGQTNGYYHAQLITTTQSGWIYRTLVRRHTGNPPRVTEAAEATGAVENILNTDPGTRLTTAQLAFAARHLSIGKPQAIHERFREGYVLAHDARLKIALWVQYRIAREDLNGAAERSNDFRPDTSIPSGARSELSDYRGSGFDRGHMAPAADMNRSENVMSESFVLSNMAPQVGAGFNRGIWRSLESAVRGWVQQRGTLTVITGPIFDVDNSRVTYRVIGNNNVAVPTGFYKIVVDINDPDNIAVLAFILPNERSLDLDLEEFLVSVDAIESRTGLDFLSALDDETEERVENTPSNTLW